MNILRRMLLSKIHRLTLTHANTDYEGSITLPSHLLEAAQMLPGEAVWVWNVTNGNRFETYTIEAPEESSDVTVNGAAAHLVTPGDILIVAAFGLMPEDLARDHEPIAVFVNDQNEITEVRRERVAETL